MRPLLLLLMTAGIAACSGSETVTVAKTETRTVTVTRTVTKQPKPPPPRIVVPARPRVFVPSHNALVYEPDTIGVGASSAITEIRWTTYGGLTAVGKGIIPSNDCVPSCAEGTITPTPITVRLTSRILCRGKLVYGRMAIQGAGLEDSTFDTVSDDTSC